MKILSPDQLRELDSYTIKNEPITSIALMERAAQTCVDWIQNKFNSNFSYRIFCGLGNNGGDGLAIGRLLHIAGYNVKVDVLRYSDKTSLDFQYNYEKLKSIKGVICNEIDSFTDFSSDDIDDKELWLDAIFGSGLTRPLSGWLKEYISMLNNKKVTIVSIDTPSGLFADKPLDLFSSTAIKADYTLSLQLPKLAFMLPENFPYVGQWNVLPIGLDEKFISESDTPYIYLNEQMLKGILISREKFSHKGKHGHALLVAGSFGMMGAAVLAARACLRSGVGLLTSNIPSCGYEIFQSAVPESMAIADDEFDFLSNTIDCSSFNAIAIGPGIGTNEATGQFLKRLIQNSHVPLIFDADAINLLAQNKTWLSFIPKGSVLTPHPGEFKRLVGDYSDGYERISKQRDFSVKYNVYLVCKGMHTTITYPDGKCYFNSTGNPGMATGGSGDVLTGIILGLASQGYPYGQACLVGVYLHGLSGDLAKDKHGEDSMVAGDIVEHLGSSFNFFKKNN